MAIQTLNTIKNWFKTGFKPSQAQFWDTWDSFRHKFEKVPVKDIEGIDELLLSKADKVVLDNHLADKNAHAPQVNTDWNSESGFSQLFNKPEFKTINGEPLTGGGDIVIEAGGAQNLQTTLGNGNETTNSIMFNDDYYNWLKTSIDSRSVRLTDSNSDMLVAIDSAGVVTRDDSQHVSLNPQGIFFNRDTAESYLRINTSSTGVSTINLPVTEGTEITLAAKEDFKTINGETIVGEGDITISSAIPTLEQVLNSDNKSLTQPIVFLDEEYSATIDSKNLSIDGPLGEGIQYNGDNINWSKGEKNLKLLFDGESAGQNTFTFPEMPDSSAPYKLATDQVVSATQSGIVNNTPLQELGGVDKLINGLRIGRGNSNGNSSTALGVNALPLATGSANTAIGRNTLTLATTGAFNTAVGSDVLRALTTGTQNVGIGSSSLTALTTGGFNLGIGASSLSTLVTGINNTSIGPGAGTRILGNRNTTLGYLSMGNAGGSSTGDLNIALGYQAGGFLTTGSNNVLIENTQVQAATLTTGSNNLIVKQGVTSTGVTTGSNNTIIGNATGLPVDSENLAILSDGSGNIAIRKETDGRLLAPTLTNTLIDSGGNKSLVTKEYLDAHSGGGSQNIDEVLATGDTAINKYLRLTSTTVGQRMDLQSSNLYLGNPSLGSAQLFPNNLYIENNASKSVILDPDRLTFRSGANISLTPPTTLTGYRNQTLQDKDGVIALLSDIQLVPIDANLLHTTGDEIKNGKLTINATTSSALIVNGKGSNYGLFVSGESAAIFAEGNSSYGVSARSTTGTALYANSVTGTKIASFAKNSSEKSYIDSAGNYVGGAQLSGTPTTPTAPSGDNSTAIANAQFVRREFQTKLKSYTVSTLPITTRGDLAYVTDAIAPTYLGTLTGGGTIVCPVFYNGTNWVSH
jgi:hypothetical protein